MAGSVMGSEEMERLDLGSAAASPVVVKRRGMR
jgi:hypothetical protein